MSKPYSLAVIGAASLLGAVACMQPVQNSEASAARALPTLVGTVAANHAAQGGDAAVQ